MCSCNGRRRGADEVYCCVVQEHQISVVRELLNDKNLDDRDRERLAFLSADFPPSPYEASVRRSVCGRFSLN